MTSTPTSNAMASPSTSSSTSTSTSNPSTSAHSGQTRSINTATTTSPFTLNLSSFPAGAKEEDATCECGTPLTERMEEEFAFSSHASANGGASGLGTKAAVLTTPAGSGGMDAGQASSGNGGSTDRKEVEVAEKVQDVKLETGGQGEKECTATSKGKSKEVFDRFSLPTPSQVQAAGDCTLVGESGQPILFSTLIKERGKVVVVFLRHLWCGLCQQYVKALSSASSPSPTSSLPNPSTPPLYILLISSGSPSLISIYRERLNCPFPLYVDKGRKIYKALGMTRCTLDGGPEGEKGGYTGSRVGNWGRSALSSLAMPLYPGAQRQLGGEFIFDSSQNKSEEIKCIYASRMSTTRNHSEVRDLFAAAGVDLLSAAPSEISSLVTSTSQ